MLHELQQFIAGKFTVSVFFCYVRQFQTALAVASYDTFLLCNISVFSMQNI